MDIRITSILKRLELFISLHYFGVKYEVSILARASNIYMSRLKLSKPNDADMQIRLTFLEILISKLRELNKLYMHFSKEEKRNIELNALLVLICPSFDRLKLLHRVDEYEALFALVNKLDSMHFTRDTTKLYPNVIEHIETLIKKHWCQTWLNPRGNPDEVKKIVLTLEDIARRDYVLTSEEWMALSSIHGSIVTYQECCIQYHQLLKRDLAILIDVNDYLGRKIKYK